MPEGCGFGTLEPRTETEPENLRLVVRLFDDKWRQVNIEQAELGAPRDAHAGTKPCGGRIGDLARLPRARFNTYVIVAETRSGQAADIDKGPAGNADIR